MASILRVNTLTDASSNNSISTSFVFSGSAKCWAKIAADGASCPTDKCTGHLIFCSEYLSDISNSVFLISSL